MSFYVFIFLPSVCYISGMLCAFLLKRIHTKAMIIVIEFDSLLSNFLEDLAHYFIEVK